jgi:hypothetical protein
VSFLSDDLKIFGSDCVRIFFGSTGKKSANYSMLKMDIAVIVPYTYRPLIKSNQRIRNA